MKADRVLLIAAVVMMTAARAQAWTLVGRDAGEARIVVGEREPESVLLAANDLAGDVARITGVTLPIVRANAAKKGDVFIQTVRREAWEAYEVAERDGVLRMTGADERGTMFAVYDFIERYLGVDPMVFWSGVPYPKKATLSWEKVEIRQNSPSVKFRGWFINDEDLLTSWRPGSGTRDYSDYPYYHDVVNHDTIRAIAEAAVRSRMNLIIPASLLNIMNPAERGIVEICAKRGLFVSMHHIEPMGVSGFAFEGYWKQRGEKRDYSYFRYRDDVEKMWRDYAAEWAKFPNVIWQIGLRGKGDRAMWITDPTMPKDDAGRAKLISNALYRQLQILDEVGVPRDNRFVTTTLWAEGAVFYEKGLLKIPDGTTIVFADNNCGWRWQNDLMNGHRQDGVNYGVYYHHQLIGSGPHLVSLVPAAKTAEMLRTARAKGAGGYAIFNVGNIREFAYGIDATAKMTWDLDAFDAAKWTRQWLERRVPSAVDAWQSAVDAHYSALKLYPETGVPCFLDGLMKGQCFARLGRITSRLSGKKPKDDGRWRMGDAFWKSLSDTHPILGPADETIAWLEQQRKGFASAVEKGEAALARTAADEREFAADLLLYPSRVMLQMTMAEIAIYEAEDAFANGDVAKCIECLQSAKGNYEAAIAFGEAYCHGKWSGWYNDCRKVSIVSLRDRVSAVLGRLSIPLDWKISKSLGKYVKIEGSHLIVDVPAGVSNVCAYATAEVELSPFRNATLEAGVYCRGARLVQDSRPARGVKLSLHYNDPLTGDMKYPAAIAPMEGDFDWTKLNLSVSFGNRMPTKKARLVLGLQQTSGRIEFDLSSAFCCKAPPLYPNEDNDRRVSYPERITSLPRMRGVMGRGVCRNTEKDIDDLRNYGANLVRLQMNGFQSKRNGKNAKERTLDDWNRWLEKNLDHAEQVLGWLEKRDMMMVLDLHNPPLKGYGREGDLFYVKANADRFISAWREIAVRFKGRKGIYGYDLGNEPDQNRRALPDCDYWNIQRRAAEAIREVDPEATIIVESNGYDCPAGFAQMRALDLDNVIYQVHMYLPHAFTHQGANGAPRPSPDKLAVYPDASKGWNKDYLRRQLKDVREFQLRHNAKIYVGEFSACIYGKGAGEYLADCIDIFEEYGWDWTYHSFREALWWNVETVVDEKTGKPVPNFDNPRLNALVSGFRASRSASGR